MEHRLGVALRAQRVPSDQEIAAQVTIVVNFAVENDDFGAILVEDRLVPASQIDDTQPPHAEPDGAIEEQSLIVWPAMADGGAHRAHDLGAHRMVQVCMNDADDAAHCANDPPRLGRGNHFSASLARTTVPAHRSRSTACAGHVTRWRTGSCAWSGRVSQLPTPTWLERESVASRRRSRSTSPLRLLWRPCHNGGNPSGRLGQVGGAARGLRW